MYNYISLLRGINVSGQKKISMPDLKALYESLDLKNVKTYIQSGNVVFQSENSNTIILAEQIEKKILEKYQFDVPVIIRTPEEVKKS